MTGSRIGGVGGPESVPTLGPTGSPPLPPISDETPRTPPEGRPAPRLPAPLTTDPVRSLEPVQLARRGPNLNGLWLGGPVRRASDRAAVGPQRPTPGRAFRTDVIPTRYDPASTNLASVPPLMPRDGNVRGPVTIHVNGIDTSPQFALDNAQQYADLTGRPTVILYNATSNAVGDVLESGAQIARLRNDRAVNNLADAILHELLSGKPVNIAAESQGAIITRNALEVVRAELLERYGQERPTGRRPSARNEQAHTQTEAALSRVTVETYGGAADHYPYGPHYVHYINEKESPNEDGDAVADSFGLGAVDRRGNAELQRRAGGDRAVLVYMEGFDRSTGNPLESVIENHVFANYLHELEGAWVAPERRLGR